MTVPRAIRKTFLRFSHLCRASFTTVEDRQRVNHSISRYVSSSPGWSSYVVEERGRQRGGRREQTYNPPPGHFLCFLCYAMQSLFAPYVASFVLHCAMKVTCVPVLDDNFTYLLTDEAGVTAAVDPAEAEKVRERVLHTRRS